MHTQYRLIAGRKQPQQLIHAGHNHIGVLVKHTTRLASLGSTLFALLVGGQCLAETRPMPTRQPVFNQVSLRLANSIGEGTGIVSLIKQSGTHSDESIIQFFAPLSTQIEPMPTPQTEQKSDQTDLKSEDWCYFHILFPLMAFVIGLCIALGR